MNAHKLRAPVASILGLINLFQHAGPSEQKIILNYLRTCGEQLDSTIRAINRNLEDSIVQSNGSAFGEQGIGNQVIGNQVIGGTS